MGDDIRRFSYNTALARLMELLNHITKANVRNRYVSEKFLVLLSPFAPYLCEECWERLGHETSIYNEAWPEYVEEYTVRDTVEYVIQINGKVRAKIRIEAGLSEQEMEALAMDDPRVQNWLGRQADSQKNICARQAGQYCGQVSQGGLLPAGQLVFRNETGPFFLL